MDIYRQLINLIINSIIKSVPQLSADIDSFFKVFFADIKVYEKFQFCIMSQFQNNYN